MDALKKSSFISGRFSLALVRKTIKKPIAMEEKILAELKKQAEPLKCGQLADALGADKNEVDKAIKKLVKEGKLVSPKRCFYDLAK